MWLSAFEVGEYLRELEWFLLGEGHVLSGEEVELVLCYWQQDLALSLVLNNQITIEVYSPGRRPVVDVFVCGEYRLDLTAQIRQNLRNIHELINSPG